MDVKYLVAKNTVDDTMFPLVQRKLAIVGKSIDGHQKVNMETSTTSPSKRKEQPTLDGWMEPLESLTPDMKALDMNVGGEVLDALMNNEMVKDLNEEEDGFGLVLSKPNALKNLNDQDDPTPFDSSILESHSPSSKRKILQSSNSIPSSKRFHSYKMVEPKEPVPLLSSPPPISQFSIASSPTLLPPPLIDLIISDSNYNKDGDGDNMAHLHLNSNLVTKSLQGSQVPLYSDPEILEFPPDFDLEEDTFFNDPAWDPNLDDEVFVNGNESQNHEVNFSKSKMEDPRIERIQDEDEGLMSIRSNLNSVNQTATLYYSNNDNNIGSGNGVSNFEEDQDEKDQLLFFLEKDLEEDTSF